MRSFTFLLSAAFLLTSHACAAEPDVYQVGGAKVDITPDYPIRLSGFGFRRAESEGVTQRIWAKALAIDDGEFGPAVIVTIDTCIIPIELTDELAKRMERKAKLQAARLAVTITHTHTAPMIKGTVPTLFGQPIPKEHQEHIDRYSAELLDKLEQVCLAALADRKPAKLSWGVGSVDFASNRRTKGGPVDHDLPVLVVKDLQGKVRAILASYACHCVTLSNNKVSGDWAGYAQEAIQDDFPGALALVAIGCGADQNPNPGVTGDKAEIAQRQGSEVAKEVKRVSSGFLAPISDRLTCSMDRFELSLGTLPTKAEWEERAKRTDAIGHHARVQLDRLARGEALKTQIPYRAQTIVFGDSLGMVFLPGEVVVDYGLRLKKELDRSRLWVNGYSNDCPCYIPSERVLKEGGYEGGGAMTYYDLPAALKTGLEEKIVKKVHEQIGRRFTSPIDSKKTGESRPLSPQQSLKALHVQKDLAVELVAAEPLVTSPVAIDWGPDGKLYVAEMYDYPEGVRGDFQPGGRIKVLEDIDGDWRYDKATVFLDNIPFPTGVTAWRKGVLICAAPDILYAEDTDGDGKADVVKKLFSGFGTHNYQGRVNSLEHGLDGWVYGSCGLFGGKITCRPLVTSPLAPLGGEGSGVRGSDRVVNLGDRDFRIKPDEGLLEPATGRTQQGRVRDDCGNWFGCDSGTLCRHYPLMDHYLRRNPHYAAPETAVHVPQSQKLFPLNPQLQLFKLSGPAGVPTAACGLGIYRDDRLGPDFTGNAFVCEPVNLLVTRMKLEPKGSTFIGVRAPEEQDREFLASTDPWFRPVQARTGPDGCLWIVDMYRYVIEHPRWIPPEDLAKLDLRAGSTMGRIYRVRRKGDQEREMPKLSKLDAPGLVHALDSPNGWQRDMAGHMLVKSEPGALARKKESVAGLEKMATENKRPESRLHAIATLGQLGKLSADVLERGLQDKAPGVRRHAIRLCESRMTLPRSLAFSLAADPDGQVRLQFACSLGEGVIPDSYRLSGSPLLSNPTDRYLAAAVLSGLRKEMIYDLVSTCVTNAEKLEPVLEQVVYQGVVLAEPAKRADLVRLLLPANRLTRNETRFRALAAAYDAARKTGHSLEDHLPPDERSRLLNILAGARNHAADSTAPETERLAAIRLLGCKASADGSDHHTLVDLLAAKQPPSIQSAVLAALGRQSDPSLAELLVANWKGYSPALRAQALDVLLSRPAWGSNLLTALENGSLPAAHIDAQRRQRLLAHKEESIRTRAARLFDGPTNPDRQKVLAAFADVVQMRGDIARGKQVFTKTCSTCHRLDDVGHDIGPDLRALGGKTPQFFLQEILDPNRNMDTRYVEYIALTKAGRTVTGILAAETATSITLRGQERRQEVLLRSEIDELQSSGKSLMPEGLEKDLSKQDLADVIAFIMAANAPREQSSK